MEPHDVYEQIFQDFNLECSRTAIVSSYYSEEGFKALHSYPQFNLLHPLFSNLTARERILDSHEQPLHLLAPHIYSSHVEFEAISTFILTVMASSDTLQPMTKDYSVITTKKLALNYVQSHKLYLAQKSDKLKIRHYLLAKEAINRSQS